MVIPVTTVSEIEQVFAGKRDSVLELLSFDLEDGSQAVRVVTSIKRHLEAGHRVRLLHPSQALAHNLYRIGFLNHPLLLLESIRMEEPSAS